MRVDIPVQTKLFASADKQRKVCMSVESRVLFLMKSSEGDRQKEGGEKTISQSNRRFVCEELPAKRNGAHASQVQFHLTGDRPA